MGRFLPIALRQGERRLLRVKRTLDNYFLCFAKLLKTAMIGRWCSSGKNRVLACVGSRVSGERTTMNMPPA